MFKKTLVIDADTDFTDVLKESIIKQINTQTTIVNDLDSDIEEFYSYNLYIIRLHEKTEERIKQLAHEDKFIIIITDEDNKEVRKKILSFHVSDYVVTNSVASAKFVAKVAKRLQDNAKKTVLVVDDSKVVLTQISMLLEAQNINYILCHDGQEAWELLNAKNSKKIDLVVTDYEMPIMDGYNLVKKVRTLYSFEELPMLVLSGTEDTYMISRFLKVGANDYITKPFINEEFIGRVNNTLLVVNMFNEIKNMAMTDHLTGLHNRVYFYETATKVLNIANRAKHPSAVAMIDIDNFKSVNDTYGHEVGDQALIHVGNIMQKALRRSDILVRFGGEEFVILLPNCPHDQAMKIMQKLCSFVAKSELNIGHDTVLKITVSVGVTSKILDADAMIEQADKYMYTAKQNGKNQVYSEE